MNENEVQKAAGLYRQILILEFAFLFGEITKLKFDPVNALIEQIENDVEETRKILD